MSIDLLVVGKTNVGFVQAGIDEYFKRLKKYIKFDIIVLPDVKNVSSVQQQVQKEGELILQAVSSYDYVVLLDEKGTHRTSEEFAEWMQQRANLSTKRIAFIIGGAFGFSQDVYDRVKERHSVSKMTFSHQMIRLLFIEQLYRAFTIIRGEPYHHK